MNVPVYLGLGSNLGERRANIQNAIVALKNYIQIDQISTIIETDPVGGPPQGKFLNAVLKGQTNLSAEELLDTVKAIETNLGRTATVKDGPRVIDIDILLYDQFKIETPKLTIPHPRMLERDFVMTPLKEIAPELVNELHKVTKNPRQCA